jgi:hypothetical protein
VFPSCLNHSNILIAEERKCFSQKVFIGNKISIKYRYVFTLCRAQTFLKSTGFEACPIIATNMLYIKSPFIFNSTALL